MKPVVIVLAFALILVSAGSAAWYQAAGGAGQARVDILDQSAGGTTFEVTVPGIEVSAERRDGRDFSRVTFPGGQPAPLTVGRPEVPMIPVLLAIPTGARVSVHLVSIETQEFQVKPVMPFQPAPPIGRQPDKFVFDQGYYARDESYPATEAAVKLTAGWHDLGVASIHVYPVQVNPGRGTARVASRMVVRADFSGGAYPQTVTGWMIPMYSRLVANWPGLNLPPAQYDPAAHEYLAIAYGQWYDNAALRNMLAWIAQRGYRDTMMQVNAKGMIAESVKALIRTEYEAHNHALRWVLLVGEPDQITVDSYPNPCSIVGHEGPYKFGDYLYSDFGNGQGDSAPDFFPEVGIGRICVNEMTTGDLNAIVAKTMNYQLDPKGPSLQHPYDWLSKMQLVNMDSSPGGYSYPAMEKVKNHALSFYEFQRYHIDGQYKDNDDVIDSVNAGAGSVLYFGHGAQNCWWKWSHHGTDEVYLFAEQIDQMDNGHMTPVVVQLACYPGDIRYWSDCLTESWIRKPDGGAVAAMGCTDLMYCWPDSAPMLEQFASAIGDYADSVSGGGHVYSDPRINLGDIKMMLNASMAVAGSDQDSAMILSYLLLGDPSLPMWTGGAPKRPLVTYPHVIPGTSVPVSVSADGAPVCSALVCLSQPRPGNVIPVAVLASGRTDSAGNVNLDVPENCQGNISVTVTEGHVNEAVQQPGVTRTPILPFTSGSWYEYAQVPLAPSGKKVKDGGWLAYNAGNGLVYGAKGYKTPDFYSYNPAADRWSPTTGDSALSPIPPGTEGKPPAKGCVGCADGSGHIYMTKGNNKLGFYKYDATADLWTQKKDVPMGLSNKKVKGGTGIAWAYKGDTGYAYLLKGYKNEFWRYHTNGDSWHRLDSAPVGGNIKYDKGSWLVSDGGHFLYAHKAKYHEFYLYDTDADTWSGPLTSMPIPGLNGNKKSKDGGCGTYLSGYIYALKGGNAREFWKYHVATNSWTQMETIPWVGSTAKKKGVKAGGSITTDGSVLFALKGNKSLEFWRYVPASGGLDAGAPIPGGSAIASGGTTLDGETPLTDGLEASKPRWNPQGNRVCYSKEDTLTNYEAIYQCIYALPIVEEKVTDMLEDCEEPVYSPNGSYIAFQVDDTVSDFYQLYVTTTLNGGGGDGADEVPQEPGECTDATGTADAVAPVEAVSAGPVNAGSIIASRPVWQITSAAADHCYPEWSPNGQWLCYERDDNNGYTQIWRVPAFGGQEQQLTFGNSDHFLPSYLSSNEIAHVLSPNDGYDKIAKVHASTQQVTLLSNLQTDHDRPNPASNGTTVVAEALDDAGNTQIVKMSVSGGNEAWLTSGSSDIMEPDYSQDNRSVFAVRWTGITSQIVCVDGLYGGYSSVTDSLAIRDNPDAHLFTGTSIAVYEREAWNPLDLLLDGGRRRHGSGIYLSRFRLPLDGPQGASLGVLALDRAEPNPATNRVKIRWQVPAEAEVSLRIYNTAGQLVKVLANGRTKPGAYTSVWNGTDNKGRRLANGVYFYALDNGAKRISRKLVLTE